MSFLKSNLRNQKMKENLLKVVCIGLLAFTWILAALIVTSQRTAEAAVKAQVNETLVESEDEVIPDDEAIELEEAQMPSEIEEALAGAGNISSLLESLPDLTEASDVVNDFIDGIIEEVGLVEETEGDYAGAPSDVPTEALSRPETEALIEETDEVSETEAPAETEPVEKQISNYPYDEDQAVALAQLMWAEARGCSMREQSLVAWTVLNRVDACYDGMSDFWSILTAPYQFEYYSGNPYEEYEYRIAVDVLQRWAAEKDGVEDSGRTLPKGYLYYYGDGAHNYFGMNGFSNELWFGLGDPYENW